MKLYSKAIFCIAIVTTLSNAKADVLASFALTGSLRTSSDSDPFTDASSITDGSGLTSGIDTVRGNPTPALQIVSTMTDANTQAGAVTANDYVTFTLTPNSGASFSLTSLSFDYANYSDTATFPAENFVVRSSVDSFAANTAPASTAAAGSAGVFASASLDLTGAAFQNVATPIEFRIYLYDNTTNLGRGALLDNIVLNGTTIPEPSSLVALFGGMGILLGFRRLRSRMV